MQACTELQLSACSVHLNSVVQLLAGVHGAALADAPQGQPGQVETRAGCTQGRGPADISS